MEDDQRTANKLAAEANTANLIARLHVAVDINERAAVICELAYDMDPQVPPILHAFIVEVSVDRQVGRHGSGNTFWAAVACILVRFGIAEFLDWYTDGPAPSETWLTEDVEAYLSTHSGPPPIEEQQPIHFTRRV